MYKLTIKYRSGRRVTAEYESKHDLLQTLKIIQDFCFTDEWKIEKEEWYIQGYKDNGIWNSRVQKKTGTRPVKQKDSTGL